MPRKGHSEEHIVFALKSVENGTKVQDIIYKLGITEQIFYRLKKQLEGLGVSDLRELRQLREENCLLKRLAANLSLDKNFLREVLSKKSEGCSAAQAGGLGPERVRLQRAASLRPSPDGPEQPPIPVAQGSSAGPADAPEGAGGSSGPLWLSVPDRAPGRCPFLLFWTTFEVRFPASGLSHCYRVLTKTRRVQGEAHFGEPYCSDIKALAADLDMIDTKSQAVWAAWLFMSQLQILPSFGQ